ncbi:hypothetical protein [Micromonospora sagamiensis]|uniref:Uncharacterized protein n=1 Tax=Micromonospora sagamiensis TaxID=47875 RepID=A0A562WLW2_9ACTN|nr:hypothetical protein [Micromonospora sagamiensis]TWJ31289.1 hypothetical protein JD81_04844 [Micromonospora sagamiensis]BCL15666.1 hypothetical protein GCM10017556_34050 [Micromonospora sagamiensis]
MSPFFAVFLVLLLGSTSYAAGRLHGQLSYRIGYRFGYRQGYFDGDRGAWNRRRREAQAALASALAVPPGPAVWAGAPVTRAGTTYTGSAFAPAGTTRGAAAGSYPGGRQPGAAVGVGRPTVTVGAGQSTVTVGGRYPTGTLASRHG